MNFGWPAQVKVYALSVSSLGQLVTGQSLRSASPRGHLGLSSRVFDTGA